MSSKTIENASTAITIQNISKVYHIYQNPSDRLKQMLWPGKKKFYSEFPALCDISFEIKKGQTVGILGRNGSGKSTLLQILCQTLQPSRGEITITGRVAALLELGAGFNPEFTGRENVYLNAAILGMSREETDARFESITKFADIGDFIEQPVKTYSSGMYVRLAFATAISVDPDILIIDEALSVGDEAFQRKCFARIEQIQAASSILQLCSRAILLDNGEKILEGKPKFVVNQYQKLMNLSGDEAQKARSEIKAIKTSTAMSDEKSVTESERIHVEEKPNEQDFSLESFDPNLISQSRVDYEQKGALIRDLIILNSKGNQVNTLQIGNIYTYQYHVDFKMQANNVAFGMLIKTVNGIELSGARTLDNEALLIKQVNKNDTAHVSFEFSCNLLPGTYFINAGVVHEVDHEVLFMHRILDGAIFQVAYEKGLEAVGLVNLQTGTPIVSLYHMDN